MSCCLWLSKDIISEYDALCLAWIRKWLVKNLWIRLLRCARLNSPPTPNRGQPSDEYEKSSDGSRTCCPPQKIICRQLHVAAARTFQGTKIDICGPDVLKGRQVAEKSCPVRNMSGAVRSGGGIWYHYTFLKSQNYRYICECSNSCNAFPTHSLPKV
jgi:hypothetical protein